MITYVHVHPHAWYAIAAVALVAVVAVGWAVDRWWRMVCDWPVVGWHWWQGGHPDNLPGPSSVGGSSVSKRAGEYHADWDDLDPDTQADQFIAELRDDDPRCPDDFPDGTCKYCGATRRGQHRLGCAVYERNVAGGLTDTLTDDPALLEWDSRQHVARIQEIRLGLAELRTECLTWAPVLPPWPVFVPCRWTN